MHTARSSRYGPTVDLGPFTEAADPSMLVVTAGSGAGSSGCLVGFHTQCSIDPPRYAVALSKANHTYSVAVDSSVLGVNLLAASQVAVARLFGGETADDGTDKFDLCDWVEGPGGVRLVSGSRAWLVGTVLHRIDVGDHVIHVLEPVEVGTTPVGGAPLRHRAARSIHPGHPE